MLKSIELTSIFLIKIFSSNKDTTVYHQATVKKIHSSHTFIHISTGNYHPIGVAMFQSVGLLFRKLIKNLSLSVCMRTFAFVFLTDYSSNVTAGVYEPDNGVLERLACSREHSWLNELEERAIFHLNKCLESAIGHNFMRLAV